MKFYELTDMERRVLDLMAAGCTDRQIALATSTPVHTVHNQVRDIRLKLRAANRTNAVHKAHRIRLLSRTRPIEIPDFILDQMRQKGATP